MITSQIKKLSVIRRLVLVSIILIPLFIILFQKDHTAHANTSYENTSSEGTVIATDLNVRETGNISSKIIGLVHQGATFKIIQTKNNWDQIKLSSNQTGWVYNGYITKASSNENINATVEAIVLNVRENPNLSSSVVGTLKLGTKITVREEHRGWAKIMSSSDVQGWVYEYYITKNAPVDHKTKPDTTTYQTTNKTTKKMIVPSQTMNNKRLSQLPLLSSQPSMAHLTAHSFKARLMQNTQKPLKGKTIVIDPGHGGQDAGTTSQFSGVHEKSLTLATANVVEQKLESSGANVIMTRTTDTYVPLQQRADLSNRNHADAFISFHYNWSNDPSANGLVDFYYQKSRDNLLASDILNEVAKTTQLQNNGTGFDNLNVLRNNSQPSTLIELGFLSNKHEETVIESAVYRDEVAQGVYQGLIDYFSLKK